MSTSFGLSIASNFGGTTFFLILAVVAVFGGGPVIVMLVIGFTSWMQVARIARHTAAMIGLGRELLEDEIVLDDRYHAGIYGIPDAQTLEAMRLAARLEAMITDPVYEGKSMAGLIDLVSRGEIDRSSNVLYAHLGGQPAINGYGSLFS